MWKKSSVLSEASFSRYDKPLKRDGKHSLISSYSLKSKEHEKVIQKLKLYEFYANGLAKKPNQLLNSYDHEWEARSQKPRLVKLKIPLTYKSALHHFDLLGVGL